MTLKCEIARNVEVDGKKFKIVDPADPCAIINKILARHEGSEILSPKEYELMTKKESS